jgi:pimeloyl-ACP methyl ester carboxylesterase/DNA-binding CsgD family transcriptional regulator
LIDHGDLPTAAAATRISYTSARNTLNEIKRKIGVDTIPMLIGQTLDLMFERGTGPSSLWHDVFDLTDRQFAIARSVSTAASRGEIARSLGVSDAVINAELKEIHLILGVRSSGEVARIVAQAMEPADPDDADQAGHTLPMAQVQVQGRQIGYSDFGPAGAPPVLILHSTVTARAPPTRLVQALQQAGFRVLAVDRPGFGDSDPAPDRASHQAVAAADIEHLCRHLGIARLDVVARGSGHAGVLLARALPHRVDRLVLVNPTPAAAFTQIDQGMLGMVKRRFVRHPPAIDLTIRTAARFATATRLRNGMLRSFRASPADLRLATDDPQFVADYLRAVRDFARGRVEGYVTEQAAWAQGEDIAAAPAPPNWCIMQASGFLLHEPAAAIAYYQPRLPGIAVNRVDDAGQMLAYSHPEKVVDALRQLPPGG